MVLSVSILNESKAYSVSCVLFPERAIVAIRNLCEGNPENQAFIASIDSKPREVSAEVCLVSFGGGRARGLPLSHVGAIDRLGPMTLLIIFTPLWFRP